MNHEKLQQVIRRWCGGSDATLRKMLDREGFESLQIPRYKRCGGPTSFDLWWVHEGKPLFITLRKQLEAQNA